ncbi:MAG TPA: cobalamin-independent methionine synthase II family protein [Candidatus Binataceae bacterium]|nr:cobalamin-independent methionine synthase II family protein [Candidatus Binataceae bacterium]
MKIVYRADLLGSLLRPKHLKAARQEYEAGRLALAEFKRIEDRCVDAAIAMQEGTGVEVITDGELRRSAFFGPFTDTIEGLTGSQKIDSRLVGQGASNREFDSPMVIGKLRRRRSIATEEFAYARARANLPLKATLPSPLMMFLHWSPEVSRSAYRDPFEMFADAAAIMREEVRDLAAIGCTYIQIDAPEIGILVDPETRRTAFEAQGISADRALTEGMDLINSIVAGVSGVTFGLHLCRGNYKGNWFASGGYESIARNVFERSSNYDLYLLEFDDPRSGSFEPLRQVPAGKGVVLGLISSKTNTVEPIDAVLARIDEAAHHFPRELMAVSTQCGFASVMEGNPVSEHIQETKLRLVAEVARRAWS